MTSKYFISIKTSSDEYNYFEVSREVYMYVKQLESHINYPEHSKLLELYPNRFHRGNYPHGKR